MDDAALMKVADGVNNRTDHLARLLLGVYFFLADFLVQFSSREVFEDEVDILLVDEVVIEFDDVGVAYALHDVYLAFQQDLLLFVHFLPS